MNIAQAYFFRSTTKYLARELPALALIGLVKYLPSTSSIAKYFGRDGHAIDVTAPSPPGTVIVVVDSLQTDNSLLVFILSVGMNFGNDAQRVFRKHAVFVCLHNVAYSKVFCINHCLPPFLQS